MTTDPVPPGPDPTPSNQGTPRRLKAPVWQGQDFTTYCPNNQADASYEGEVVHHGPNRRREPGPWTGRALLQRRPSKRDGAHRQEQSLRAPSHTVHEAT
jgi:hypothetical protein